MLGHSPIGARPIGSRGLGSNDFNGMVQPSYPPGWGFTHAFHTYGWQDNSGAGNFQTACQDPNFPMAITGMTVVLPFDQLYTNTVPTQLQFIFDNVPLPPGKHYLLNVHLPMSALTQPPSYYPFQCRPNMSVLDLNRKLPVIMPVPVLSPANFPLVTAAFIQAVQNLIGMCAANGHFTLVGFNLGLTSDDNFDAQITVPSDTSEATPAISIANWAASPYNVTMQTLPTLYGTHAITVAQAVGRGRIMHMPILNPGLGFIGQGKQGGGTGQDYHLITSAITNALWSIGDVFYVMDQSYSQNNPEPLVTQAAKAYSGGFLAQIIGGQAGSVLIASAQQLIDDDAVWFELVGAAKTAAGTPLDQIAIAGWNGRGQFIPPYMPASICVTS